MMRDEHQVVVEDHLRRRRCDVSDSCSSSCSINEQDVEEEEVDTSSTPLQDMSSLLLQLPLKRGLSEHYNGKSRSFTSLSNVKSLEDLAKQENPFNKKIKRNSSPSREDPLTKGSHFTSLINGGINTNNNYNNDDNVISNPIDQRVA